MRFSKWLSHCHCQKTCQPPDTTRCFLSLWPPLLSDCRLFHFDPLGGSFERRGPDLPSRFLARAARSAAVKHALDLRTRRDRRAAPSARSSLTVLRVIRSRVKRRGLNGGGSQRSRVPEPSVWKSFGNTCRAARLRQHREKSSTALARRVLKESRLPPMLLAELQEAVSAPRAAASISALASSAGPK